MDERKLPPAITQFIDDLKNLPEEPVKEDPRQRKVERYYGARDTVDSNLNLPDNNRPKYRPLVKMTCRVCNDEVEHLVADGTIQYWEQPKVARYYTFRAYCHGEMYECYVDQLKLDGRGKHGDPDYLVGGKIVEASAFGNDPFEAIKVVPFGVEYDPEA